MNDVGVITEEEHERIKEAVEKHFVGDTWAIEASLWDDGDVHLEAFSTIGNSNHAGYSDDVWNHQQVIVYERDDVFKYQNRVEYRCEGHRVKEMQVLQEKELDW